MKINQLLLIPAESEITVVNEPFSFVGKIKLELDGGDERQWFFSSNGTVLAISAPDDEIFFLRPVDEELEPQSGMILYQGKEYESNYEDSGKVMEVEGEVESSENDRFAFADYENENGDIVRVVTNENTGEIKRFTGGIVVDDEILAVD